MVRNKRFDFNWLLKFSQSDSQAKALVNHLRNLDDQIHPVRFGIRKLRDILINESDRPYFWLDLLESAWRVYMFQNEGPCKASYSPNFKRSCSTSRKIGMKVTVLKKGQKNAF